MVGYSLLEREGKKEAGGTYGKEMLAEPFYFSVLKQPNLRGLWSLCPNLSHELNLSTGLRFDSILDMRNMEKDCSVIVAVSDETKSSICVEFSHHPERDRG